MELPMPKEKPSFYAGDVIQHYRSELIQRQMEAHGFDAILSLRPETVRFCTGFFAKGFKRFWESVYFTLIPLGREPVVGYRSGSDWWRIQLRSDIKDYRRLPGGLTRWAEVLIPVFSDYGLQKARVGTDILPYEIYTALKKEFPEVEFRDAGEFWVDVTAVKHPAEIEWIRKAVEIVDIGTQAAIDSIAPGKREIDVSVEASCAMLRAGAEMMPSLHDVASGYNAGIWERIATEKTIREGELVAMDITASVRGYVGDIGR
ncbi:MAG: M24 family metallopeptidase, partial [Bacillota bacterium]